MPADPAVPSVRPLSTQELGELLRARGPASFLPVPAGGPTGSDRTESLGWFPDAEPGGTASDGTAADGPVAAAATRHHGTPGARGTTVTLVDGPDLDWVSLAAAGTTARWLAPLVTHLRDGGAATVSVTPPVPVRAWHAPTVSAGLTAAATRPGTGTHPSTAAPVTGSGFPLDVSDRDAFPADEPVRQARAVGDLPPDDRGQSGAATAAQLASGDWQPSTDPRPHRAVLRLGGVDEGALWSAQAHRRQEIVQRAEAAWVRVDSGEHLLDDTAGLVALPLLPGGPATGGAATAMWQALAGFGDRRRVLVARRDDRVLAAVVTVQTGTVTGTGDGPGVVERVVGRWAAAAEPDEDPETSGAVAVLSWQLVRAARTDGAAALDLGPVDGGLDPHASATAGLHEVVATGADVVEMTGEWALALHRRDGARRRLTRALFGRH